MSLMHGNVNLFAKSLEVIMISSTSGILVYDKVCLN